MTSTPYIREVQKASVIQIVALYCIFLSSLRGYERRVLLKNHKRKPYSMIGMIHILYRSHF